MIPYWLGVLTLPIGAVATLAAVYLCFLIRKLAGQGIGKIVRRYPPVRDGEDMGLSFPAWSATEYGNRSAFAAIALTVRTMYLIEPLEGLGIFVMIGRPGAHTEQSRRARRAIENAYDDLLKEES